jgi:amino acid adenylation domain-containing protein
MAGHHIAFDGWSLPILSRELAAFYRAHSSGRAASVDELTVQYADYAVWQRGWLSGELLEHQLEFWKKQLHGLSTLDMRTDRPRPAEHTHRGDRVRFELPPELASGVQQVCRELGATPYMFFLAMFQVLLARQTGQVDIAVGTPIANRLRRELEPLIGFFANTIVMRTDLSGNPTVRELMRRVKSVTLEAYAHQDLPFDLLVEQLKPERTLGANPLFQVAFAMQGKSWTDMTLEGLVFEEADVGFTSTRVDLEVYVRDTGRSYSGTFVYCPDLWDSETVERWAGQYVELVESALRDLARPIGELALWSSAAAMSFLEMSHVPEDRDTSGTIHERFSAQAGRTPGAVAVVDGADVLTYADLERRSNAVAELLQGHGVGRDCIVGVCLGRSAELIVAFLAVLKSGGVYMPLDPEYPDERLAFMLKDARAELVLARSERASSLRSSARVVAVERGFGDVGSLDMLPPTREAGVACRDLTGEALAYVMYTSGSTGAPKGVAVPHRGVIRLASEPRYVEVFSNDVFLFHFSPCFDASTIEIWMALLNGAAVHVMAERFSLEALASSIRASGVTLLVQSPALFKRLLEHDPGAFQRVRQVIVGGDVLGGDVVRAFLDGRSDALCVNAYGPTENTTITTVECLKAADGSSSTPIGKAIQGSRAYVLDSALRPVPPGVIGELYASGTGLARGYVNRPAQTASQFVPDPYSAPGTRMYRTGDRARYLPDGRIEFVGRVDDQVKVRGYRIELGEVEAALRRMHGVRDAAAIVRPDELGGALIGFVVPEHHDPETDRRAEERAVDAWFRTIDGETYADLKQEGQDRPNTAGWTSVYTGEPISERDMREWLDSRVEQILALAPRRVLELGCGTGMVLARVAPRCEAYVATDFSGRALAYVRELLARGPDTFDHVSFLQREADRFEAIDLRSFDLVIINSVVQYFPSQAYLDRVIRGALGAVRDGGAVFVGDVRDLDLVEALHLAAVRIQQPNISPADATAMARTRAKGERELLVAPAYFQALPGRFADVEAVELTRSRAGGALELAEYRYNALLRVGDRRRAAEIAVEGAECCDDTVRRSWTNTAALSKGFNLDKVRQQLESTLPSHMVPAQMLQVDALPLNASGKVDRKRLGALAAEGPARRGFAAPEGSVETTVAQIWREVLGTPAISRDDNFFELGGHSLLATRVASRVRETFAVDVPLRKLFEHATLRAFSQWIDATAGTSAEPALARRKRVLHRGVPSSQQ